MKKLLFSIAMMAGIASLAQNSYSLSTYTSDYTELNDPTVVQVYDVDDDTWDEPVFIVPFGFDFQMNGETYDFTFQYGSGAMMGFGGFNIQDSSLTSPLINTFGLFDDLVDGDYINGLPSSEIAYQIQGAAGNRIAVIQYKDAAFYNEVVDEEPSADNRINFQLWFYEVGGILEIHFGTSNITDPTLVYDDAPGPLLAVLLDYNINTDDIGYNGIIYGEPANPTFFDGPLGNNDPETLNSTPESGRVYRLSPGQTSGLVKTSGPQFSIYPTLVENEIWVETSFTSVATYRILDITGKEVQVGQLQSGNPVSVSTLNPGLYLLSIDGMGSAVKFVKE